MNELVKEGILIKINSRPVYFMHRKSLERLYDVKVTKSLFYSIDELMEMLLRSDYCQKDFGKAIGNQLSLSYSVEQCKAGCKVSALWTSNSDCWFYRDRKVLFRTADL